MAFDEDGDLRHDPVMRSDPAHSIRSERASGILRDIAHALGIAPATFFASMAETSDSALAVPSEAADPLVGTPFARYIEVLRRDLETIARPDVKMPKLSS